jgi:hypothetical protein
MDTRIKFGGRGTDHPVGGGQGASSLQTFTILLAKTEDVVITTRALAQNNSEGWISVITEEGPAWIPLPQFIMNSGLF